MPSPEDAKAAFKKKRGIDFTFWGY
jgi:hypothetical protein